MKLCKKCNSSKSLEEFSKSRVTNDKLQIWCKSCMSDYGKKSENKDRINSARRKNRASGYYQRVEKPKRQQERKNNVEKYLWKSCKDRASKYNLPFTLEISDIIVPELCPLLEIPLFIVGDRPTDNSPTIDKIIPELGYIKSNIRVISRKANWMKSNAIFNDFEKFYRNIFNYLENK